MTSQEAQRTCMPLKKKLKSEEKRDVKMKTARGKRKID